MNDITISSKRIKKELLTLLICFLVGLAANTGAIIFYKSAAIELLTSLPYVLVFSGVLYLAWSIIRILYRIIRRLKKQTV